MSLTALFAVCILSIDFMIYFFFKLLYGEKKKRVVRRLPPEYYNNVSPIRSSKSSPLYSVPARKSEPAQAKRVITMRVRHPSPARVALRGVTNH
jgi:hypothetical protein